MLFTHSKRPIIQINAFTSLKKPLKSLPFITILANYTLAIQVSFQTIQSKYNTKYCILM